MTRLTGRLSMDPSETVHREVLEPQFRLEVAHLLPHYVRVEKALLLESLRLGFATVDEVRAIGAALDDITAGTIAPDPTLNLSDVALAIERLVSERITVEAPTWHVDRSRNDLQASVQLMFGRDLTLRRADELLDCAEAAHALASRHVDDLLPGYTHLQPAQVITPGFVIAALLVHLLHTSRRLLATYDGFNLSPLGSGAMAGQELAWDRARLAGHLGFAGPQPHALIGVASRSWVLELAAESATFGVGLGRFITDLMTLTSGEYGLAELSDDLAGISAAMPQKKNYPVLERIRGRTAHLTAWYLDVAITQRATPYSNSVEVGKESTVQLPWAMDVLRSTLVLMRSVLDNLTFRTAAARARCAGEFLGGFSLATMLTLRCGIPWRTSQVIAGQYIVSAQQRGLPPAPGDAALLGQIAHQHGWAVPSGAQLLAEAFDPDAELRRRSSAGGASPTAMLELLDAQAAELARLGDEWGRRRAVVAQAGPDLDRMLAEVVGVGRSTDGKAHR
jgi:argininosuccinate lyase